MDWLLPLIHIIFTVAIGWQWNRYGVAYWCIAYWHATRDIEFMSPSDIVLAGLFNGSISSRLNWSYMLKRSFPSVVNKLLHMITSQHAVALIIPHKKLLRKSQGHRFPKGSHVTHCFHSVVLPVLMGIPSDVCLLMVPIFTLLLTATSTIVIAIQLAITPHSTTQHISFPKCKLMWPANGLRKHASIQYDSIRCMSPMKQSISVSHHMKQWMVRSRKCPWKVMMTLVSWHWYANMIFCCFLLTLTSQVSNRSIALHSSNTYSPFFPPKQLLSSCTTLGA